jgi:hypothetical protein
LLAAACTVGREVEMNAKNAGNQWLMLSGETLHWTHCLDCPTPTGVMARRVTWEQVRSRNLYTPVMLGHKNLTNKRAACQR